MKMHPELFMVLIKIIINTILSNKLKVLFAYKGFEELAVTDAVKNKKGALRIVVYEQMQNKLYYFYIPRRVWKDYSCGPIIPFCPKTGDPKDTNHWWQWEVDSFIELARIKKEDWINVR